ILVDEAKRLGVQRIIGEYRPTEKNGMVREHYQKLGFSKMPFGAVQTEDERHSYVLPLDEYNVTDHPIQLERA
ncbi:MAG: hypothetical protein KGJ73_12445, partial [Rhodospirillales bacterium]|nr:hypothetical protein [Rhodospirillales bacterium]